jgi:hypothetical protein
MYYRPCDAATQHRPWQPDTPVFAGSGRDSAPQFAEWPGHARARGEPTRQPMGSATEFKTRPCARGADHSGIFYQWPGIVAGRAHARRYEGWRAGGIVAWFVYEIPPIDFWWEFLPTVADVAAGMASDGAQRAAKEDFVGLGGSTGFCLDSAAALVNRFYEAKGLAERHGWEGDFSFPARVLWLPEEGSNAFAYAFVWKQCKNGMTYVVSPHPLPWLGKPAP